jgi:hypothetical protein
MLITDFQNIGIRTEHLVETVQDMAASIASDVNARGLTTQVHYLYVNGEMPFEEILLQALIKAVGKGAMVEVRNLEHWEALQVGPVTGQFVKFEPSTRRIFVRVPGGSVIDVPVDQVIKINL